MMLVKADLVICSPVIGVPAYKSVAFMSSHYLDFSSSGIFSGFHKSSHISLILNSCCIDAVYGGNEPVQL